MVILDMSIVNVALPNMQQALDFSPSGLSWVLNAYTLAFGGLLLLGARAGDLLGRRRTFLAGVAIFTAASLLGGFATTAGWLVGARAVQGVGAALAAPATLALLMSMFREGRERTRALGLYTAVSVGGAAIGLIAGGMLTEWLSWRWVMYVNVPIGVALLFGIAAVITETPRQAGRFDLTGALTSTLGMTALVYGFVHAATSGWGSATTVGAFAAGAVLLAAFVLVELRAAAPITPLGLFADRTRSGAHVARLLLIAGMTGMFFFLTQFLQDVLGYSALQTGMGFLPVTIALFIASQASARVLMERFGDRRVTIAGVALSALSLLWLSQLSEASGYVDVLGPLVLLGIGNGIAFVPLTAAGLAGVPPEQAGAASGLVNVTQQVGGSLGLSVLVTVFGSASRNAAERPLVGAGPAEQARHLFVEGADAAFLVAALMLAAAVVVATLVIRARPTTVAV
ncbi:MAG: DHA2 family efflux MFS transporter permease subunit [Propionibacteriales bacterium]|nr:DHA2 family efflux MFS transporter permease subunit [Propionibacteriales bacterium]